MAPKSQAMSGELADGLLLTCMNPERPEVILDNVPSEAVSPESAVRLDRIYSLPVEADSFFSVKVTSETTAEPYLKGPIKSMAGPVFLDADGDGYVNAVAFSPEGRLLATAGDGGVLRCGIADDHTVVGCFNASRITPVYGVVLKKMGQCLAVGQVIDPNNLNAAPLHSRPKHLAADPPEPVDSDTDAHAQTP